MNFPAELRYTKDHEWIKLKKMLPLLALLILHKESWEILFMLKVETVGQALEAELFWNS